MLSKQTTDRIEREAMQHVGSNEMKDYDHEMRTMKSSYIAGATAEALRALPLVEALGKIMFLPTNHPMYIDTIKTIAHIVLDNYKNNK